jgi:hypothetical protein
LLTNDAHPSTRHARRSIEAAFNEIDLHCATGDDVLRRVISDGLNEIRGVNLVRSLDMRACLLLVAALSASERVLNSAA